jgi:hypothetical protein
MLVFFALCVVAGFTAGFATGFAMWDPSRGRHR